MELKEKIIDYFFDLLSQPHPNGYTDEFLITLAKEFEKLGARVSLEEGFLTAAVDANGPQHCPVPIVLQSHLDMVGLTDETSKFNFTEEELKIQLDESLEWLSAVGTNFGAVNGIAIIYMLLLLQEKDFIHPPLYFLISTDKESGMNDLRKTSFHKNLNDFILINLDAGHSGDLVVSSPGSEIVKATYTYDKRPTLGATYELKIFNLNSSSLNRFTGENKINPIKILGHVVAHLLAIGLMVQVVDVNCKQDDLSLPDSGSITLITSIPENHLINAITGILNVILPCSSINNPDLKFTITPLSKADKVMAFNRQNTGNIAFNMLFLPESTEYSNAGFPLASSDLFSFYSEGNKVYAKELIKFSDLNFEGYLKSKVSLFYSFTQGFIETENMIQPWIYEKITSIQKVAEKAWEELTGEKIRIRGSNEVLEVSYFNSDNKNLNAISIGPTVENMNTPNEKLNIEEAIEVYEFLKLIITKLAEGIEWNT